MDEIIYLEPDEEITSAIDKIKKAQSKNLGLVIPRDATLLQSVVNLRLLSREANTLGKKISIVTADKIGRNLASQIGLPVFSSIQDQTPVFQSPKPAAPEDEVLEVDSKEDMQQVAQAESAGVKVQHYNEVGHSNEKEPFTRHEQPVVWHRNEKPVLREKFIVSKTSAAENSAQGREFSLQKPTVKQILSKKDKEYKNLHKVLWPVLIIFIILCGVAAYLLLPKAVVTISVPSENLQKDIKLSISSQSPTASLASSVLPGSIISSEQQKQGTFNTSGQKDIGTKASGTITVYNYFSSSPQSFSTGTEVQSSGKAFVTKTSIVVPGATLQGGIIPGKVSVGIEAKNPGSDYNVKSGIFTIVTLKKTEQGTPPGSGIYGQSSSDLTGGMSRVAQVVSQSDYDNAKTGLIKDITDLINQDIQKKSAGKKLVDKALVAADPVVTATAKVGDEAANFQMTVKLSDQAIVFSEADLNVFLQQILEKDTPSDKMVSISTSNGLTLTVDNTAYDKGQLNLTAKVNAEISAKISQDNIKQAILGKKLADAQNYIKSQSGISDVEIKLTPSWLPKQIPELARNVTVKIDYINKKTQTIQANPTQ